MIETKVLIGSPIHQDPAILKEFLVSLRELDTEDIEIDFFFIDDNEVENSKELLQNFHIEGANVYIKPVDSIDLYECTEQTHRWNDSLIWKVAGFKNQIIQYAKGHRYDYLFLVDSDLVLHPATLRHLISQNKDIVSEIFWTKWTTDTIELPQVWLYDKYTIYEIDEKPLTEQEIRNRIFQFIDKLRKPGIYEVGGLGACTLISQEALQKEVSFSRIPNVSFWGEDRHFCIRAAVLGLKLYVDTCYPAYHIYRQSDLKGVKACKQKWDNNTILT